jgi:hypothetical protein
MNQHAWGWNRPCGQAGVDLPALLWPLAVWRDMSASPARLRWLAVKWLRLRADTPPVSNELLDTRLSTRECLRSLRRPTESVIFVTGTTRFPAWWNCPARLCCSTAAVEREGL